jgi:hypothetical protein
MFKPKYLFLLSTTSRFTSIPFIVVGYNSVEKPQIWEPWDLLEHVEDDNVEGVNAGEWWDDESLNELVPCGSSLWFVFEILSPSPSNLLNLDSLQVFLFLFVLVLLIIFLPCKNMINVNDIDYLYKF